MAIYKKLETINTNLELDTAKADYTNAENALTSIIGDYVVGTTFNHNKYGIGTITNYRNNGTLDCLIVDIDFAGTVKAFSLSFILSRLAGCADIENIWNTAFAIHTELTAKYNDLNKQAKQIAEEAEKKAAEAEKLAAKEKKAAERLQALKDKNIKNFESLVAKSKITYATGEFYYNLGWLAKNIGTISAALPDYLLSYFEKHFGTNANPTVVDSKKRTVNGHPMQWTFSMKASLRKNAADNIPAFLKQYLNSTGTSLANTSFIWDLVDNYGFKFGKKQNLEQIKSNIPAHCLEQFENGFAA